VRKKKSEADCFRAMKARYEAAIPSEPKPTLHQEEKESLCKYTLEELFPILSHPVTKLGDSHC
jgi:hypothetical protein